MAYMIHTKQISYIAMVVLLFLAGPRHPPTADDSVPLGTGRILLGWLTLSFLFVGFTIDPVKLLPLIERPKEVPQQQEPSSDAIEVRLAPRGDRQSGPASLTVEQRFTPNGDSQSSRLDRRQVFWLSRLRRTW